MMRANLGVAALVAVCVVVFGMRCDAGVDMFRLTSSAGPVGVPQTVTALIDNPNGSLQGWSFGVCHDPSELSYLGAVDGSTTMTVQGGGPPDFSAITPYPTGIAAGVVVSFFGTFTMPAGYDRAVLDITYSHLGPVGLTAIIDYCGTLGSPAIDVVMVSGGITFTPPSSGGVIDATPIGGFLRGDADGTGALAVADMVRLHDHLWPTGSPPTLLSCIGAIETDSGDVNDNEHLTIGDQITLRDHLFCGTPATLGAPTTCGADPDADTDGFSATNPAFVVTAASVTIIGTGPTNRTVEIAVRVQAPIAVRGVMLALQFGSALTPHVTFFSPSVPIDFSQRRVSGNTVVLGVAGPACGSLLPASPGVFQDIGVIRFALADFAVFPPIQWLASTAIGGTLYRASVVGADYRDYHPSLVSGAFQFARGNANNTDAAADIADAIYILDFLFPLGSPFTPPCLDAADTNNDGSINIADAIYLLQFLFAMGPTIPLPYPQCGFDTDLDALTCGSALCP
ncbi:MAG: hypothetical protein ACKVX7_20715 [Planctomycetota bacterium]